MKRSPSEQEQIVALLTRLYSDICVVETEFGLLIGEGDFRPRIEYFHDAIRALTSQDAKAREKGGRLSVEMLSYDVSCLRYIHSMPLSPFKPHAANLSPSADMVKLDEHLVPTARRPDRVTKERLAELYQRYGVLFAALLKPFADADYADRTDDLNHDVRDINHIIHECERMASSKGDAAAIRTFIEHLDDDELRRELQAYMQQGGHLAKENMKKLILYLKGKIHGKDKEINAIDRAHLDYAMAQLGIYEGSKDLLKKMAGQGMNLVGKFVEDSIAKTRREMGR